MRRPRTWLFTRLGILLACLLSVAAGSSGLHPTTVVPFAPAAFVIDDLGSQTRFAQQSSLGSVVSDTSEPVRGDSSMALRTDGDASQVNLRASGIGPFDLSEAYVRLLIKVDAPERLDQALLYLSSDGFASYETYRLARGTGLDHPHLVPGGWVVVTAALGTPLTREGPDPVDRTRLTDVQLSANDTGDGPVTVWFAGLEAVARPPRGLVSVVFDDARDGVYALARPLLERAGLRASVAVIVDLVDEAGFMTLDELQRLDRFAGWDLIAHHASALQDIDAMAALDDDELRHELVESKRWLLEHGFHRGADHLAYPLGYASARMLALTRQYFASGRTILRGVGLETWPPADAYRIRALSVTPDDTPAILRAAIDQAALERSWLVLVFHQVVDGAPTYGTAYAVDDLAAVVEHLARADVDVRTLPEVLRLR